MKQEENVTWGLEEELGRMETEMEGSGNQHLGEGI